MIDRSRAVSLLHNWARWADRWWYDLPGSPGVGCFGTGYDAWGVQTNQKYVAVMAMLAHEPSLKQSERDWALARAMSALRYSLASHVSGSITCTDGAKWGHTWISALGVERMMHGVDALRPHFTDADNARLRQVLESECDWLTTLYERGGHKGIQADRWNESGKNDPESNLWNGSLLWRGVTLYPDHPHVAQWREQSLKFLANGVSIAADATDGTVYDGKPLRDRHVGASFFDSYALDHHGYLNVGYMVICVSNAGILHFDHKLAKLPTPELLHLHQKDLWAVLRSLIFNDGRLARIGGDSRVRYAYCQEYLVPSLLYAADHLGETNAKPLLDGILAIYESEAKQNGDGSFYGKRLEELSRVNPYYYTRLEGDRASALSMALAYAPLVNSGAKPVPEARETIWIDTEHGAVLHRSPTRFASFSWRAFASPQGLCLPPQAGNMAEWDQNLTGEVTFAHHPHPLWSNSGVYRRAKGQHHVESFDGGFLASGSFVEGSKIAFAEGWQRAEAARHYLAFVALPDDHTVVGIQVCRIGPYRAIVSAVKGMLLNIANGAMNDHQRHVHTAVRDWPLNSRLVTTATDLQSNWVTIDGRLSAMTLYGSNTLTLDRSANQRGGSVPSMTVDQLCTAYRTNGPWFAEANSVLLDCAWLVSASLDAEGARKLAAANPEPKVDAGNDDVRAVRVLDVRGNAHLIALNVSESAQHAMIDARRIDLPVGRAVILPG